MLKLAEPEQPATAALFLALDENASMTGSDRIGGGACSRRERR